jgi:hypothetical protein
LNLGLLKKTGTLTSGGTNIKGETTVGPMGETLVEMQTSGFQEEFMAKVNEFSESWREAAMNEQRT